MLDTLVPRCRLPCCIDAEKHRNRGSLFKVHSPIASKPMCNMTNASQDDRIRSIDETSESADIMPKHRKKRTHYLLFAAILWSMLPAVAVAQRGPAVVQVEPIIQAPLQPTQYTIGTVEPSRVAVIGSAVDGRVNKLLVREGDFVKENTALAKLLS